jgi:hypothetical protein
VDKLVHDDAVGFAIKGVPRCEPYRRLGNFFGTPEYFPFYRARLTAVLFR